MDIVIKEKIDREESQDSTEKEENQEKGDNQETLVLITDSLDQTNMKRRVISEAKEKQEEPTKEDPIMIDMKDRIMMMIVHLTEEEESLKEKTEGPEDHKERNMMAKVMNDQISFIPNYLLILRNQNITSN